MSKLLFMICSRNPYRATYFGEPIPMSGALPKAAIVQWLLSKRVSFAVVRRRRWGPAIPTRRQPSPASALQVTIRARGHGRSMRPRSAGLSSAPVCTGGRLPWSVVLWERTPIRCVENSLRNTPKNIILSEWPGMRTRKAKHPVVLVVEDEPLMLMNALELVAGAGFEVISARSADEAILILESRDDIRVIFTDINMPGSMDGQNWRTPPAIDGLRLKSLSLQARVSQADKGFGAWYLPFQALHQRSDRHGRCIGWLPDRVLQGGGESRSLLAKLLMRWRPKDAWSHPHERTKAKAQRAAKIDNDRSISERIVEEEDRGLTSTSPPASKLDTALTADVSAISRIDAVPTFHSGSHLPHDRNGVRRRGESNGGPLGCLRGSR